VVFPFKEGTTLVQRNQSTRAFKDVHASTNATLKEKSPCSW